MALKALSCTQELSKKYLGAIVSGNEEEAEILLNKGISKGLSAKNLYLNVLIHAQRTLLEKSHNGAISLATERLATQITLSQMSRLRSLIKRKSPINKYAVISSVSGDSHHIGGRMAADLLYMDGWDVDFLGADTPPKEIANYVEDKSPNLLGLSITVKESIEPLKEVLALLQKKRSRPKIVLGGLAVTLAPKLFESLGADALVINPKDALSISRQVVGLQPTACSLEDRLKFIGRRISTQRKLLKMSQQDLGTAADLDRAYISSIEHGKQNITLGALLRISEALELSLEELVVDAE
jgi:methanogenic corrinoid protein MtbC1/DNA-binding XRE family transcriptional regulator